MLFPAIGVLAAGKHPGAPPPLFSAQGDISLLYVHLEGARKDGRPPYHVEGRRGTNKLHALVVTGTVAGAWRGESTARIGLATSARCRCHEGDEPRRHPIAEMCRMYCPLSQERHAARTQSTRLLLRPFNAHPARQRVEEQITPIHTHAHARLSSPFRGRNPNLRFRRK